VVFEVSEGGALGDDEVKHYDADGPIPEAMAEEVTHDVGASEMSLEDTLLTAPPSDDYTQPRKWCRICWRPKPERAHHCSQYGHCILKMDHHIRWMAKCIVHRLENNMRI